MDFQINSDNSLSAKFMSGGLFKYGKATNLRAFYMEITSFLNNTGWDDITWENSNFFSNINANSELNKGELPNTSNLKRTKNMYEEKFIWIEKGNGTVDFELLLVAKKNTFMFNGDSIVKFKLSVVNRNMKDIELLEGNNKKILQDGTWEFRNEMEYQNIHFKKKLKKFKKIPFFSEKYLKDIILKMWYTKDIDHDILKTKQKMFEPIDAIVKKYFT